MCKGSIIELDDDKDIPDDLNNPIFLVAQDALEQALTGMAVLTGFFSLFGMMGAIKENYCATMTFAIYYTINTVANFYVAFQANGLWLYAIINLCIAIISFNFAKHLRAQRLLRSLSTSAFVIDPSSYPHQTIVVPVGHEWTTRVVRQQWVSDPPPYTSHEFTENPYNTKHYIP